MDILAEETYPEFGCTPVSPPPTNCPALDFPPEEEAPPEEETPTTPTDSKRLSSAISKRRCKDKYAVEEVVPEVVVEVEEDKLIGCDIVDGEIAEERRELFEKIEGHLLEKIEGGDELAGFLLGQFYYEEGLLRKAVEKFEEIKEQSFQATYQLATIFYDGIGCPKDEKRGFEYMMRVASSESLFAAHLVHSASYKVGKAYFEGYGVRQNDKEAEKWWLLAAADGDPRASVEAQTMLGMFYSRPEFVNLKKSFFWHSEACGNGSLESQGILGVMYMMGQGIKKDLQNALECLKGASERGNIYAQGRLVQLFYERKLYTKACDLARRLVKYDRSSVAALAEQTNCLATYILKGIALAAFYLSRCLSHGRGMRRDMEQSHIYFNKVCELDSSMAHDYRLDVTYGLV